MRELDEAELRIAAARAAKEAVDGYRREQHARIRTNEALAQAHRQGTSKSELARLLGVARQTITYRIEEADSEADIRTADVG